MSQENVELARQVMEAIGRRDAERLVALSAPEVEWHSFFAIAEAKGIYFGFDGTRKYMKDLDDAWEIAEIEVDDTLEVGAIAVLVGRIHYRGRGSGVESESPAGWVFRFRNGKLIRFRAFREPEQALEAAGLSE